jgi:hypothetical protein
LRDEGVEQRAVAADEADVAWAICDLKCGVDDLGVERE